MAIRIADDTTTLKIGGRMKMFGSKMSGAHLERLLNDSAAHGWQLKAITTADVRGRIGPGGVEGLLVTFGRMRS
jgi:hypothetical protein